jgi:hypothetical protein
MYIDIKSEMAAQDVVCPADPSLRARATSRSRIRAALSYSGRDEDDAVGRPDGVCGQDHALDQHVRLGMQEDPVLEGARLHLVGVADYIPRMGCIFGHGG